VIPSLPITARRGFCGLMNIRMKKKIKDEFMAGEMNLHDVFLYTRLLIARKNLTEFTKEFGLKSKGTLSYFEAGRYTQICHSPPFGILARKHLIDQIFFSMTASAVMMIHVL